MFRVLGFRLKKKRVVDDESLATFRASGTKKPRRPLGLFKVQASYWLRV